MSDVVIEGRDARSARPGSRTRTGGPPVATVAVAALFALLCCATALPAHAAKARKEARAAGASAAPVAASSATSATPVPASDFEAFRLIVERNIFNPNRTGRSRAAEEAPPRFDTFALVGTLQSEGKVVAIFDSTDDALRKSASEGGTVADFTVKKISPNSVELVAGEKSLVLRMGQQLRRAEGGEWRLGSREAARAEIARVEFEAARAAAAAAPVIPVNASEVVRRLMEQRQKQLKQ